MCFVCQCNNSATAIFFFFFPFHRKEKCSFGEENIIQKDCLLYQARISLMTIQTFPVLCAVLVLWCDLAHFYQHLETLLAQGSLQLPMVRTAGTAPAFLWQCPGVFPNQELIYFSAQVNCTHVVHKIHKPHFWEVLCTLLEKEQSQGLLSAVPAHSNQLWEKLHGN